MNYLIKKVRFSLVGNYLRPSNNYRQVILIYVNFSFFTVFLKNRNISSKIKRSKVTDYAALNETDLKCNMTPIKIKDTQNLNSTQRTKDSKDHIYQNDLMHDLNFSIEF